MQNSSKVLAGLMELCIGDALGVSVESSNRNARTKLFANPM